MVLVYKSAKFSVYTIIIQKISLSILFIYVYSVNLAKNNTVYILSLYILYETNM